MLNVIDLDDEYNKHKISTCKKGTCLVPKPKFTYDDWRYNNAARLYCCDAQQKLAKEVIAKLDTVCKLSTESVKSNRDETNHCLDDRIKEIENCKQELLLIRRELQLEIDALQAYKTRLVDSLKSLKSNALETCNKCLVAREHRIGIDLVSDSVEKELREECEGIRRAESLISETLEKMDEQLRRLKATQYFIDRDLEDKENNLRIDRFNTTLKETSLNLSIYHGSSALSASSISIEEWELQTKENIDSSAKEMLNAKKFRSQIELILKQIMDDLKKKKIATDNAFRQRIDETKAIKEKLELEHSEIMRQADEMTRNITRLEKLIAEKEGYIALAHTRLGNRCQRPGLELTRDNVEKSLINEVSNLRQMVAQLQQTLFEAQASLRFLLKMQMQLEEDINIKTNSIKIDEVHCMTMRQSIDYRIL
ncbi:tektin-1 [Trichogramma pretiosum]|uniref:tektin-1 n=1 Tax=Trichogramma pretiosum TaxID=7493 RepID=UPI0006C9712A|nr:tektin-1 [Trichogramma pretiosum]